MKVTDRRGRGRGGEEPTPTSSALVVARSHSDVIRAGSAPTQDQVSAALTRGRSWSHAGMDAASARRYRTAGASSISPATPRPRSIEYYLDRNVEEHDYQRDIESLFRLQDVCRKLYVYHPMIGTAVDIYSKWPLVGMEFRSKDEELNQFYSELFFDQLDYEEFLVDVGREFWSVGEAIPLGSWSDTLGVWERDELIHPRDIQVKASAFLPEPMLRMRLPEEVRQILSSRQPPMQYRQLIDAYPEFEDLARSNDPYFTVSPHLMKHIKFKADTFFERGIPIMTRGIRDVLREQMLDSAQDAVADRMSTPLLMVRLGATATELGTQNPWIPTPDELADFESMLDAAMAADFRVMTTHFGVKAESVFGREAMPNFDNDFDRIAERILQVYGMSKTMLSGAGRGETFAADAMNRDLVTQLMASHQRRLKRFVRERALVVAEANDHFEYEERNGKRHVVMEEVLLVDENGNQRIEERPKLMVPDLFLKPMNLKDEEAERRALEEMRANGVPISLRRRLAAKEIDLDEELESSREERVQLALEEQRTRREIYLALKKEGLPIPEDLRADFAPMPEGEGDGTVTEPSQPAPVTPGLGEVPQPLPNLAPVGGDPGADFGDGATAPALGPAPVPLEGQHRPPESDEMRADMPTAAHKGRVLPKVASRLGDGPAHMLVPRGTRVHSYVNTIEEKGDYPDPPEEEYFVVDDDDEREEQGA